MTRAAELPIGSSSTALSCISFKLSDEIMTDLKLFIETMEAEPPDIKSIGIKGTTTEEILKLINEIYQIEEQS